MMTAPTATATAPRVAAPAASPPAAPAAQTPQPSVAAVDTTRPAPPARARPAEGGWIVQISAQKTESEAQAAFRTAQAKFSALAGYQPLIRKKDQGERGVFYATQVGPFPRGMKPTNCAKTSRVPAVTASSKRIDAGALALGRGAG